jgi:hypothetical protein
VKHYSLRTEQVCVGWIRRFILANGKRHPHDMGAAEVEAFLNRAAISAPCKSCHKDVKTTQIHTHVLNRGGHGVTSPLDR